MALYEDLKPAVEEVAHSQYAVAALDWIFSTPTFRTTDFEKHAGIPAPTARRILRCLENAVILAVIREASGRRLRVLSLQQLLAVAEARHYLRLVDHETATRDPQTLMTVWPCNQRGKASLQRWAWERALNACASLGERDSSQAPKSETSNKPQSKTGIERQK